MKQYVKHGTESTWLTLALRNTESHHQIGGTVTSIVAVCVGHVIENKIHEEMSLEIEL